MDEIDTLKSARTKLSMHEQRRAELATRLQKSIALKELWPEVFDRGAAKSVWIKPAGEPDWRAPSIKHPNEFRIFRVTNGAGEEQEFAYACVPEILGGGLCD